MREGILPPQAIELETDLLGSFLLESNAIERVDFLTPEMFYRPEHQAIFKAIQKLNHDRKPIDYNTVTEQLEREKKLDEVGGIYKLVELTSRVSSSANIEYYSRVLYDKWYARELIKICTDITSKAYTGTDIDTLRASLDSGLIKLDEFENTQSVNLVDQLVEVRNTLKERQINTEQGVTSCVNTPLKGLNKLSNGGFHNGDLVILAARPAMGKTLVASEFAQHFAKSSPGAFLSLEMTTEQLILRMLRKSGASMYNMMNGTMTLDDWRGVDTGCGDLSNLYNISIKDNLYDLYKIGSYLRKLKKEKSLEWAVIDYLGLVETSDKSENRNLEIGKITRYLKKTAKELSIPIILLSQLNRNDAGKRPQLTDLRDSGNIEQDADTVIFIHRPEYYSESAVDDDGLTWKCRGELIVAKNRQGHVGTVIFQRDEGFSRIWDYDPSEFNDRFSVSKSAPAWDNPF